MEKTITRLEINRKKIVLRRPAPSDCRKVWKFYNQAIKEGLQGGGRISSVKPVSLKEEEKWIKGQLKKIKNKDCVCIVAEFHGRIIGITEVQRTRNAQSHIGNFGIVVLEEFTGKGLGTRLMSEIMHFAKKELKIEIIKLGVFGKNKRAQGLYKKLGFKEAGRIRKGIKVKGRYQDEVTMVKYL